MRITPSALIGLAALLPTGAVAAADIPPMPVGGDIRWVYRLDEGLRAAKESNRPLFVVFRCER